MPFSLTELQRSDSVLADQSGGSPVEVRITATSSYIMPASVIHFAATVQTRACCVEQHGSGLKTKAFVASCIVCLLVHINLLHIRPCISRGQAQCCGRTRRGTHNTCDKIKQQKTIECNQERKNREEGGKKKGGREGRGGGRWEEGGVQECGQGVWMTTVKRRHLGRRILAD